MDSNIPTPPIIVTPTTKKDIPIPQLRESSTNLSKFKKDSPPSNSEAFGALGIDTSEFSGSLSSHPVSLNGGSTVPNPIHVSNLNLAPKVIHVNNSRLQSSSGLKESKVSEFLSNVKSKFVHLVKGYSLDPSVSEFKKINSSAYTSMERLVDSIKRDMCPHMDDVCYHVYLWLLQVTKSPAQPCDSFIKAVQNGSLLFNLANTTVLRPPPSSNFFVGSPYAIHQILWFLTCCRNLGLPDNKIFSFLLLTSPNNDPRPIILTLMHFDKACRSKGWTGPAFPDVSSTYFDGSYIPPEALNPKESLKASEPINNGTKLGLVTLEKVQGFKRKTLTLSPKSILGNNISSSLENLSLGLSSLSPLTSVKEISETDANLYSQPSEYIEAFLQNENKFVQDLKVCFKWQEIVHEHKKISNEDQIVLFRNLQELYELHENMYQQMIVSKEPDSIAAIFLHYFNVIKSAYERFNHDIEKLDATFVNAKDSVELKQMLNDFMNWPPSHGISLEFYMLMIKDHPLYYINILDFLNSAMDHVLESVQKASELFQFFTSASHPSSNYSSTASGLNELNSSTKKTFTDLGHGSTTLRRSLNKVVQLDSFGTKTRTILWQGAIRYIMNEGTIKKCNILLFRDVLVVSNSVEENSFDIDLVLALNLIEILPGTYPMKKSLKRTPEILKYLPSLHTDLEKGISELIENEIIHPHPIFIASFLQTVPHISRKEIARYLSDPKHLSILLEYLNWLYHPLLLPTLLDAFRLFLSTLYLEDGTTNRDYLFKHFCSIFERRSSNIHGSQDKLYELIQDLYQINCSIHEMGSKVLSKASFFDKYQGLKQSTLEPLYEAAVKGEFKMASTGSIGFDLSNMIPESIFLGETIAMDISIPEQLKNVQIKIISPSGLRWNPATLDFSNHSICRLELKGLEVGVWKVHFLPSGDARHLLEYIPPKIIYVQPSYMKHTFTLKCLDKTKTDDSYDFLTFAVNDSKELTTWKSVLENAILTCKSQI